MTLDATRNFDKPLTGGRLFDWHAALFPAGRSGMRRVVVGAWRDDRSGPLREFYGGNQLLPRDGPVLSLVHGPVPRTGTDRHKTGTASTFRQPRSGVALAPESP